jgi:hypothetical protein
MLCTGQKSGPAKKNSRTCVCLSMYFIKRRDDQRKDQFRYGDKFIGNKRNNAEIDQSCCVR